MGLRLVPRTIEGIKALGRLAVHHAVEKPLMEREERKREEERQRKREEEIRHEQERAYARERGERQAIIEMQDEARWKELEHARRMLAVRERAEEIAQEGHARRSRDVDHLVGAIATVADRFKR